MDSELSEYSEFETLSVGQSAVALLAVGWKARDHESHQ